MRISFASGCQERTTRDGSELRYYDVGSGDVTVVLLHGLFGSPSNWLPVMQQLGKDYRFIALQLPIDASSSRRTSRFRCLSELTDHVVRLFDELDLDRAVIGGNSLGGQVSLDFCLSYPERVEGLILAGSAGLFEHNLAGGHRPRVCRDFIRDQASKIFFDSNMVCDELVDDIYAMLSDRPYRKMILRVAKSTRDRYMLPELANVNVPTLIVWGRDDTITPPFVADQFHENIRNAKRVFIDQCGHAPQIEQPEEFAAVVNEFLYGFVPESQITRCKPR